MYKIDHAPAAEREPEKLIKRVSRSDYEAIETAIDGLAHDPRPQGHRKVIGTPYLRIPVGRRYRVIYYIHEGQDVITILRIARRYEGTYWRP